MQELESATITTLPGERASDAITRVLGDNVAPVTIRPVLNTQLEWNRERFILTYKKM